MSDDAIRFDEVWEDVEEKDELYVAEKIVSNIQTMDAFKPVENGKDMIEELGDFSQSLRILDFGCGLGRNIVGMVAKARERGGDLTVVGYDNENMLKRAETYLRSKDSFTENVMLLSDWDAVLSCGPYDVVFANLVFQHMFPQNIDFCLSSLAGKTKSLYVYGRARCEHGEGNVWEIVLRHFELQRQLTDKVRWKSFDDAEDTEQHDGGIFVPRS